MRAFLFLRVIKQSEKDKKDTPPLLNVFVICFWVTIAKLNAVSLLTPNYISVL